MKNMTQSLNTMSRKLKKNGLSENGSDFYGKKE
jgi:hypothetical protein